MADVLPSTEHPPSASTSPRQLCAICNHSYSIYTCPRCATRTCSLPCSTSHKGTSGCSGERDKVAYIPMNKYGWGTMMNDYVFLEEAGRRVGDWGKEIVRGGYGLRGSDGPRGRGRGGGDIRGRGGFGRGRGGSKRELLKMQLEARDIDMDLLPVGMERRKMNQSSWDYKNHTALLTIEFKFHPPIDPLSSQPREPPFVILTHRNSINTPLLALIQSHVTERDNSKKEGACPDWIKSLVLPNAEDPGFFAPPECVMTAHLDPTVTVLPTSRSRKAYYRFDTSQSLGFLLRHTHFVEFPTIELWEEFKGTVVDTQGAVTQQVDDGERKPKRRKLNKRAGKKAISGLVGGYGSDEEEEETPHNGLSLLGGYMESDEEVQSTTMQLDDELGEEDADGDTDDEAHQEMDPYMLLEMIRQVQGEERWVENTEDEEIDWGDSGEEPE